MPKHKFPYKNPYRILLFPLKKVCIVSNLHEQIQFGTCFGKSVIASNLIL